MSFEKTKWVWMNGQLIPWANATIHVSAHALHYGSGVFKGLRCYESVDGPAVFRLNAHLERLYASAAAYGMDMPYSREELAQAISDVISRNQLLAVMYARSAFMGATAWASLAQVSRRGGYLRLALGGLPR
jgi:branched-chain amino acid aminotransferase